MAKRKARTKKKAKSTKRGTRKSATRSAARKVARAAQEEARFIADVRSLAGSPRVRKSVRRMTPTEINDLRNAFEALYKITDVNDDRSYQWIAGRHGYPGNYCHRSEPDFYVWHRAYMYEFEEKLRDAQQREFGVATVTLPYWDWTKLDPSTDAPTGIPNVCNEPEYTDLISGETKPNPLFSAYSQATSEQTFRDPSGLAARIPRFKQDVETAMSESDFITAQSTINNGPHGGVHIWVGGAAGGDMRSIRTAAFDPIFYLHHSNVDRIWWEWQQEHGNGTMPQAQLDFVAAPWTYNGQQCTDAEGHFNYTYREQEVFRRADAVAKAGRARKSADASAKTATIELGGVPGGVRKALLEFHRMRRSEGSYEVRMFINQTGATAKTKTTGNSKYAGSLNIFGHGECIGEAGHCDLPPQRSHDRRPPHHYTPENKTVDVTRAVQAATKGIRAGGSKDLTLSFVVVDLNDEQIAPAEFNFDGISLETK